MYPVTSIPFVRRIRAIFRSAELGFLGDWVRTRMQTPRFCGHLSSAGEAVLVFILDRPALTNWFMVGIPLNATLSYLLKFSVFLPYFLTEVNAQYSQFASTRNGLYGGGGDYHLSIGGVKRNTDLAGFLVSRCYNLRNTPRILLPKGILLAARIRPCSQSQIRFRTTSASPYAW